MTRIERERAILRQAILIGCISDTIVVLSRMSDQEVQELFEAMYPLQAE